MLEEQSRAIPTTACQMLSTWEGGGGAQEVKETVVKDINNTSDNMKYMTNSFYKAVTE